MDTTIRRLRSIVFIALILFIAPVRAGQGTLLIMGDSLSAAYGVQTEQAWVALLRERLDTEQLSGWKVVNASISGETTDGGLRRLPDLLDRHQPDIVMIELGGNDGLRGFPPQVIRNNITAMIEQSQQAGAEVLLAGMQIPPNYGQRYTQAFAAIFPELAKRHDTELVPFFLANIYDREGLMQDDDIHPTAEAQEQLLDNVWPELQPMLEKQ
ncbi:arylesterase [Marinobacter sp.]|uniref:arylesterase n=1 Tax=Marinobacter sp. TaxID=50741 RepID=UPI002B4729EA|nr:arylesterase [Marinobacter sp.]HKK56658.1 arylesterase [Marinobacter sp.]